MKIIIAGGRAFRPTPQDDSFVRMLLATHGATEIVSGCSGGADRFGEYLAWAMGLRLVPFRPDWKSYGKAAGPIRNRAMAQYADAAILMPGKRGTESMRREMLRLGKPIIYDGGVAA